MFGRRMDRFKAFLESKAGRRAVHEKRERRRVSIVIDGIEPKSKKMPKAEKCELQSAIADHLKRFKRQAFTGDIALKLQLNTTDKNAPQAHTIAKNLLDLFGLKEASVQWPRKHLLYKDDKQIQVLSVSCRHGNNEPFIYVEATPLSVMLEELRIAAEASREDELSLEALYREDMATDWIGDYRKLVENEAKSRADYGELYEPYLKLTRVSAQQALLNQAGMGISVLNWLYEDPLSKLKLDGFAASDLANLISRSILRLQFGELPIAPGSSKLFKERVAVEVQAFKERWAWILDPLEVAVGLEVIVRPNPNTPPDVLHDLDNIVRDYLIPEIVPRLKTVTDPLWLVDWEAMEKAGVYSGNKAWSSLRSTPRLPASTKSGVTRYEVWRLPAVTGQPGILSVALTADTDGRGDLIDRIQRHVKEIVEREEKRRW